MDFDGGAAIERFPAYVKFRFNFPNSNVVIEFVFSCLVRLKCIDRCWMWMIWSSNHGWMVANCFGTVDFDFIRALTFFSVFSLSTCSACWISLFVVEHNILFWIYFWMWLGCFHCVLKYNVLYFSGSFSVKM